MVTSKRSGTGLMIVAQPNCSASWRTNQLVLLALAVPSLGGGIGLALAGAWPVLPFAGIEMASLAAALYYVNWKLQYRQVITLSEELVHIDEGHYAPTRHWKLPRTGAALAITPERHPWEGPRLALYSSDCKIPVGEFLNRDDCLSLLGLLRKEVRVGTQGPDAVTPI